MLALLAGWACGGRTALDAPALSSTGGSDVGIASGGRATTGGAAFAGAGGASAASSGGKEGAFTGGVPGVSTGGSAGAFATGGAAGTNSCGNGTIDPGEGCDDGQLTPGDGCSAKCRPEPVKVVARGDRTCALASTGVVKCWGENRLGWLGLGDTRDRGLAPSDLGENLPRVDLGTGKRAIDLDGSCALLDDRSLKCWGANEYGNLGQGDVGHRGDKPGEMGDALLPIDLGSGRSVESFSIGSGVACAILDDRSLKCWGGNSGGVLGLGDEMYRGAQPGQMGDALPRVDLGSGRSARLVAVGIRWVCAILDDASVKCWGNNTLGYLGLGDTAHRGDAPGEMGDALPPVRLGTGFFASQLSVASFHTCALFQSAAVKCWGDGVFGALGLGDLERRGRVPESMGDALPAVDLGAGRRAVQISVGTWFSCALLDDGSVKCWGDVRRLGLGDNAIAGRGDEPGEMGDALPVVNLGSGRTAKLVSAGNMHACALLDDGSVKCWGENEHGQLGLGDGEARGDDPGEMGDALPAVDLVF